MTNENSRLCALQGFLIFLENFTLTEVTSLSQISSQSSQSIFSSASIQASTQHSLPGAAHNRMLCMEIVQAIRRCLVQQHAVRAQLYCGILNVVTNNQRLSPNVIEALLDHLQLFYEDDNDIIPPVSIALCLSKVDGCIQEPLPLLLATISSVVEQAKAFSLHLDDDDVIDDDMVNRVNSIFESISTRLCKCDAEDFNIRTSGSAESWGNWSSVLILALHQVLMEHWISLNDKHSKALEVFQSFKKFHTAFTQNKVANFDKMLMEVQLASSSIAKMATAVAAVLDDDQNSLSMSENFSKHIMTLLHSMLLYLHDHGYFQGVSKKTIFDELLKISRACYHKFMMEKNAAENCPVLLLCLECFHTALKYIIAWQPSKLPLFISTVCGDDDVESQHNAMSKLVKQMQRVVVSFIGAEGPMSALTKKLVTELLSMLEVLLSSSLNDRGSSETDQFAEWWQKLCMDYEIEDVACSKRVVQLHLLSSLHSSDHPELPFRDLATDINISVRAPEEQGESQRTYKIVTLENSPHLVPIIVKHLDSIMADSEWLLAYIKGSTAVAASGDDVTDEAQENRRKGEGALCIRTCTVGVGLLDLLSSSMSSVPAIDAVINGLTTVFNFLTQFSKYYLWLYAQSYGNIPSKFEKLTSFVGSEMMRPIYAFIMHAQSIQTSKLGDGKSKKHPTAHTAGKAKVLRESKGIARLIFAIEQNEHNLIMLARRSKIELMKDYHLTTSRDFRIRTDVIQVTMNEQEADKSLDQTDFVTHILKNIISSQKLNGENSTDADCEDEGTASASKRPRLDV